MAVGYYKDRAALKARRRKVEAKTLSRGLFDLQRYTRILKALFAQMAKRHRDGLPPRPPLRMTRHQAALV